MRNTILSAIALVCCLLSVQAAPKKAVKVSERPKLMWFDISANWARFSNADSIEYYVQKCQDAGFNHLIVDVKGTASAVAYPSAVAPRLSTWKGLTRPDSFNYLQLFIEAAHRRGMKVLASFNVFCEGHGLFKQGITYDVRSDVKQPINYVDNVPEIQCVCSTPDTPVELYIHQVIDGKACNIVLDQAAGYLLRVR